MNLDPCFRPENNLGDGASIRFQHRKFLNKYPIEEFSDMDNNISSSGDFNTLYGINAIIKNIITDLRIERETYFFDPEQGSGLHLHIFEPIDNQTQESISRDLTDILDYYRNREIIDDYEFNMAFYRNNKGYVIDLIIKYDGKTKKFDVTIDTDLVKSL